jgi:hypothetical protein
LIKNLWIEWIKEGGATSDRSTTPAHGPLFGPNVLPYLNSKKKNRTEKNRVKVKKKKKKRKKKNKNKDCVKR